MARIPRPRGVEAEYFGQAFLRNSVEAMLRDGSQSTPTLADHGCSLRAHACSARADGVCRSQGGRHCKKYRPRLRTTGLLTAKGLRRLSDLMPALPGMIANHLVEVLSIVVHLLSVIPRQVAAVQHQGTAPLSRPRFREHVDALQFRGVLMKNLVPLRPSQARARPSMTSALPPTPPDVCDLQDRGSLDNSARIVYSSIFSTVIDFVSRDN